MDNRVGNQFARDKRYGAPGAASLTKQPLHRRPRRQRAPGIRRQSQLATLFPAVAGAHLFSWHPKAHLVPALVVEDRRAPLPACFPRQPRYETSWER